MLSLWTRSVIKRFCNFPLCIHPARTMPHLGAYNIIIYIIYIHITHHTWLLIQYVVLTYCIWYKIILMCVHVFLRSVRALFGKSLEERTYTYLYSIILCTLLMYVCMYVWYNIPVGGYILYGIMWIYIIMYVCMSSHALCIAGFTFVWNSEHPSKTFLNSKVHIHLYLYNMYLLFSILGTCFCIWLDFLF